MDGRLMALVALTALGLAGCGGASASWSRPEPSPARAEGGGARPSPSVMPVVAASVRPLEVEGAPPAPDATFAAGAPNPVRVRIPAIDVDAAVAPLGLNPDGTIEVPPDPSQAGWYTKGPAPGDPGPAVILGHLDSLTGPAVFYRLASLRPGREVSVLRADGSQARFTVRRIATFPVNGFPSEEVYGATDDPELRLITCGGAFNLAQRKYQSNVVVFAVAAQ